MATGMVTETQDFNETADRRGLWLVLATALCLITLSVVAVVALMRFADGERARDLRQWQTRLAIVADSRVAAIDNWLGDQAGILQGLAENASVQLYLMEATRAGTIAEQAPELDYLRNLLTVVAAERGYATKPLGPVVAANVNRIGLAGIALISADGRPVAASPGMPPFEGVISRAWTERQAGRPRLIDLHFGADGRPAIGFIAPVFAVQSNGDASAEVGAVVALRPVGDELFGLLRQPGETSETAETYLVRQNGATIDYLSPHGDGTEPLRRRLARATPNLAAAYALASPGGFGRYRDYADTDVLVTGRLLTRAPWALVKKIDANEALAEIDARRRTIIGVFGAAIIVALLIMLALWRHGASRRADATAVRLRDLATRLQSLSSFLRVVTDGQPTSITAFDAEDRYIFANRTATEETGLAEDEIIGKTMPAVVGPAKAENWLRLNETARATETLQSRVTHWQAADSEEQFIRSDHIPMAEEAGLSGAVLVVAQDITELVRERARRERGLHQLVATLMSVIDRRDPYSASHSARVSALAALVAKEAAMDERDIETVEIAGALMNLGKCLVPRQLLTKSHGYSPEELIRVQEAILSSADLVAGVDFDGPVVETLRQIFERWDGTGRPAGLAGAAILPTARIVSVVNAFVAMVSPRAHRPGLDIDGALATLLLEAGEKFDRRTVVALANFIDNRDGRARWTAMLEGQDAYTETPRDGDQS
jgi:PAS domain S-box-containing protein